MKINCINNYDNRHKSSTFGALKTIKEMDWDENLFGKIFSKAQDVFQLDKKNNIANLYQNYFLKNLYLYWQNVVDRMIDKHLISQVKNEVSDKYLDYLLDAASKMTVVQKNLIKKISKFPKVAEDSYIQDSILDMIVNCEKMNKNAMQVLDMLLSSKTFSDKPDDFRQMWMYLNKYQDKNSLDFLKFFVNYPTLYNTGCYYGKLYYSNFLHKELKHILSGGKNLPEALCLINKYTSTPSLNQNKDINDNICEIIYQTTAADKMEPQIVLDKYASDNNLQDNDWIRSHIGSLSARANRNNLGFIYNLLNIPALYANQDYTNKFIQNLNMIESADPFNGCIYTEIFTKINSNPNLYENKGIIKDIEYIFKCPEGVEQAKAKLAVMDKYISKPKYFNDVHLQFSISEFVNATTSHNLNFIKEIMEDVSKKKPKRSYLDNYNILRTSSERCFENMEDYELYQEVRSDSKNYINTLSTHNKQVDSALLNCFFDASPSASYLLKLIGRESFEKAYKLKFSEFERFSDDLYLVLRRISDEFFETVIQKTNLRESHKYKLLNAKLKKLKSNYSDVANNKDGIELKAYQNKINGISHQIRELEQKEIKDSQFKINLLRQVSKMNSYDAEKIIKIVQKNGVTNKQEWNEILLKNVLQNLDIQYNQNLINKLGLRDKPYLDKILISTDNFKKNLKEIFAILMLYPDKSVKEIFNNLPQNKVTKNMFKDIGADYDKWVEYDKNSKIELCDNEGRKFAFRKVNMNDVMYSLFLGNYSSCCMKVGGGSFSDTAPNYIKNKFISAIEVLDEDKPIGNTICYLALANEKPVLILDNIKILPEYDDEEFMRKGILSYAKKLCKEIGLKDIPVLTSSTRHSVRISKGPYIKTDYFVIAGSSGSDYIYIDDITDSELISPNKSYNKELYDFEYVEPENSDGDDPLTYFRNSIMPMPQNVLYGNPLNVDELHWKPELPSVDDTFD